MTINRKDEKIPQEADAMIIAVGVIGNTEGLGLEKTKVKVEKIRYKSMNGRDN